MKKILNQYLLIWGLLLLTVGCGIQREKRVSVESLLSEMTNMDALAKTLPVDFKTLQASSYSRASKEPGEEGWFDNADASQYVRIDTIAGRIEHVLMDVDGPGAIVRFWSTWHAQKFSMGKLRFYFDYSEIPQIEGRIDSIISRNSYVGKALSQTASAFLENGGWFSGHNLYFPLPYAKHCKVTYQKAKEEINDVLYYQINYRKYSPATKVATYQKGDWENGKYSAILDSTNKELLNTPSIQGKLDVSTLRHLIKSGESFSTSVNGAKAIKKLLMKINADNLEQALRSTVISMEFDGKQTVWAPVGDFFGTGYKISPYQSRYSQVMQNGEMSMWFPMPFQKTAKITIHNYGQQDVELVRLEALTNSWEWDDNSLYFHANWRLYHDVATKQKRDVNYITIKGKGKYVGDVLTLFNNGHYWWGEGDEKIYVDNEEFPSHFGTGTEDYYGYAWCSVVDFSAPFNAQPIGDGNRSPGLTVNSRYRALDIVPFNEAFRFDIEIWHWQDTRMDYAPTTFWYGTLDSEVEHHSIKTDAQKPIKLSNRFEAESFDVDQLDGGEVIVEAFLSHSWSAQNHLLWKAGKKGDKLVATFYSSKERTGKLQAVFTQGPGYANADIYLNGQLLFEKLNLYGSKLGLKEVKVEEASVQKGKNELTIVINNVNQGSKIGLDFIELQ
ncbi:DUF2961 domain-containing protein [Prolixibacteraceae bacterium JC049]|nr:DUF2961 domain-containing protein [Prolixibacteraceae bacterium JC049]